MIGVVEVTAEMIKYKGDCALDWLRSMRQLVREMMMYLSTEERESSAFFLTKSD